MCAEARLAGRQASDAAAREQLEKVVEVLVTERCTSMEDCIEWARKKFQARRRRPPRRLSPKSPGVACALCMSDAACALSAVVMSSRPPGRAWG